MSQYKSKLPLSVKFVISFMILYIGFGFCCFIYNTIHNPKIKSACKELCGDNVILICQSNTDIKKLFHPNYVDVSVICANKDNKTIRIIK